MMGVLTRNGLTVAGLAQPIDVITGPAAGEIGQRVFIGPTDPISDIPVTIEFEHHQVHEGETYRAQSAALSAPQQFVIVTGSHANPLYAPHMVVSANIYGGAMRLSLYEGQTGATIGAAVTANNRRRQSANLPTATVSLASGATGTKLLETTMIAAGVMSSDSRSGTEWILKENATYLVSCEEVASYTDSYVTFNWYEDLGL